MRARENLNTCVFLGDNGKKQPKPPVSSSSCTAERAVILSQNISSLLCSLLLFQSTPSDICSFCVFSPFLGRALGVRPARRFCSCSKCSFIISLMWSESELAAEWQILLLPGALGRVPIPPPVMAAALVCLCRVSRCPADSTKQFFWEKNPTRENSTMNLMNNLL